MFWTFEVQILFIVPTIYLLAALIIFFTVVCSKTTGIDFCTKQKQTSGDKGEKIVADILKTIVDEHGGYLFNNVCFKNQNGFSCEIDHLLLTRGGLFVVETKNIVGHIKGKPSGNRWLSVAGKEIISFKNPLIQNQTHITQLRTMLGNYSPKMMSLIVFPNKGSNIKRVRNNLVYDLKSMVETINRISSVHRYTKEQVEFYKSRIDYILLMFGISKEGHIANIKRIFDSKTTID